MKAEDFANELLAGFADDMGLDPSEFRLEGGYACLAVDKTAVIHMRLNEDVRELDLFMELGSPARDSLEDVFADMLQGNVLFQATEGGALGYDRARGIAVLSRRLGLDGLDGGALRDRLERFLAAASFWSGRILGGANKKDSATTAESSSPLPLLRV